MTLEYEADRLSRNVRNQVPTYGALRPQPHRRGSLESRKAKNAWSFTATSSYVFFSRYLIKPGTSLPFLLLSKSVHFERSCIKNCFHPHPTPPPPPTAPLSKFCNNACSTLADLPLHLHATLHTFCELRVFIVATKVAKLGVVSFIRCTDCI